MKDQNSHNIFKGFIRSLIGCLGILYHPMLDKIRGLLARLVDHFKTAAFHHNNTYHNGLGSTDKISSTINHLNMGARKKMFSQVKSMVRIGKTSIRPTTSNHASNFGGQAKLKTYLKKLFSLNFETHVYFNENLIRVFLIHLHWTHQNIILKELFHFHIQEICIPLTRFLKSWKNVFKELCLPIPN